MNVLIHASSRRFLAGVGIGSSATCVVMGIGSTSCDADTVISRSVRIAVGIVSRLSVLMPN